MEWYRKTTWNDNYQKVTKIQSQHTNWKDLEIIRSHNYLLNKMYNHCTHTEGNFNSQLRIWAVAWELLSTFRQVYPKNSKQKANQRFEKYVVWPDNVYV